MKGESTKKKGPERMKSLLMCRNGKRFGRKQPVEKKTVREQKGERKTNATLEAEAQDKKS